jgi:hypothetical protein
MHIQQENRQTMYKTLTVFCKQHPASGQLNPRLRAYYNDFNALLAEIERTGIISIFYPVNYFGGCIDARENIKKARE